MRAMDKKIITRCVLQLRPHITCKNERNIKENELYKETKL